MLSLIAIPLLPIIYEDLRYRAIHWIWVALLTVLIFLAGPINWSFIGTNLSLLGLQLLGISCYFSLKHQTWVNIVNRYLGLGDILFFLPLTFLFSPLNFLLFLIVGFCFSLLVFGIGKLVIGKKLLTIPLAGYLAIFLMGVLWASHLYGYSRLDDQLLLRQLTLLLYSS